MTGNTSACKKPSLAISKVYVWEDPS